MAFELSEEPKPEPKAEPVVAVYLIEMRPDGTLGVGNSHECPQGEAKRMIEAGEAKHPEHPIHVVPVDWK